MRTVTRCVPCQREYGDQTNAVTHCVLCSLDLCEAHWCLDPKLHLPVCHECLVMTLPTQRQIIALSPAVSWKEMFGRNTY
jgi:hypothetical protein